MYFMPQDLLSCWSFYTAHLVLSPHLFISSITTQERLLHTHWSRSSLLTKYSYKLWISPLFIITTFISYLCTYSVINICFYPWCGFHVGRVLSDFCSFFFFAKAWHIIFSQWIDEWTDIAMQRRSGGWWCIREVGLVWKHSHMLTAAEEWPLSTWMQKVICHCGPWTQIQEYSTRSSQGWEVASLGSHISLSVALSIFDLLELLLEAKQWIVDRMRIILL